MNNINDKSTKILKDCLQILDITDLWFDKHKDLNGFLWYYASDTPRSRIDFVFVNNDLLNQFRNILIRKIPGTHNNGTRMSDHRALKYELNTYNNKGGK